MNKSILIFMALTALLPATSYAQSNNARVIIDLARDNVDVTTGFSGSDIVVFGTVENNNKDQSVVVLLKGPESRVVVREKSQIMGMWLNSDTITFESIPHFYDYAVSTREADIAKPQILIDNGIGLNTLVFEPEDRDDLEDKPRYKKFQEALIRNWQHSGNLPLTAKKVKFVGDGLFRADFSLPANIPTGPYQVEAFLFEKGNLVDKRERVLEVRQAGLSAEINRYAHRYSLIYAFVGIFIAAGMGLLSAALSRKGR
ncbi:MAG TPA: TIGR02186 family protein [Alphaproteobacteria bacterium]|nr:TIGR02186 family protein [Alphaproteobacteria bacterium]HNS45496.1 TIGR02186 family protein [Alphaproteobacteria bacterium]